MQPDVIVLSAISSAIIGFLWTLLIARLFWYLGFHQQREQFRQLQEQLAQAHEQERETREHLRWIDDFLAIMEQQQYNRARYRVGQPSVAHHLYC